MPLVGRAKSEPIRSKKKTIAGLRAEARTMGVSFKTWDVGDGRTGVRIGKGSAPMFVLPDGTIQPNA